MRIIHTGLQDRHHVFKKIIHHVLFYDITLKKEDENASIVFYIGWGICRHEIYVERNISQDHLRNFQEKRFLPLHNRFQSFLEITKFLAMVNTHVEFVSPGNLSKMFDSEIVITKIKHH